MSGHEVVTLQLLDGALPPQQWAYAVVAADGDVLHVGSTALPPAVRTWLHLTSDDPATGRLRATVPADRLADARVLAVAVPADVDRAAVRDELSRLLRWQELTRTEPAACPAERTPGPVGELAAALAAAVEAHADPTGTRST